MRSCFPQPPLARSVASIATYEIRVVRENLAVARIYFEPLFSEECWDYKYWLEIILLISYSIRQGRPRPTSSLRVLNDQSLATERGNDAYFIAIRNGMWKCMNWLNRYTSIRFAMRGLHHRFCRKLNCHELLCFEFGVAVNHSIRRLVNSTKRSVPTNLDYNMLVGKYVAYQAITEMGSHKRTKCGRNYGRYHATLLPLGTVFRTSGTSLKLVFVNSIRLTSYDA